MLTRTTVDGLGAAGEGGQLGESGGGQSRRPVSEHSQRRTRGVQRRRQQVPVWINYPYRVVYIRFIGTHAQYESHRCAGDMNVRKTRTTRRSKKSDPDLAEVERRIPMDIAPIKTQRDYRRALKEIEGLMSARRNTPEGDRLDVLVTLVEAWEAKHYPLDFPDAVEAIKYHMEQRQLAPRDLIPFIGNRNRVYEVLSRKRPLTLAMVRRLHEGLGIPAESLIKTGRDKAA
jgi:HTH-type transcriptional regulator / antitoxin HigA